MSNEHVCPWWIGYLLASPLRRIIQKPESIVGPFVKESMKVLEIGPGMGFFTIPMARMVGQKGKVYAVDVQQRMLHTLAKRARMAGVKDQVDCRLTYSDSSSTADLKHSIDFTLLMAVVHEISDKKRLFSDVYSATKDGGIVLFAEPSAHVSRESFDTSLKIAKEAGFTLKNECPVKRSLAAILTR